MRWIRMFRSVLVRKVFLISVIGNALCLIYILLSRSSSYIQLETSDHQDPIDLHRPHVVSSTIYVIPMVHNVIREQSRLILSDRFRFVSNKLIQSDDLTLAINRYRKYISSISKIAMGKLVQTSIVSSNDFLIDCSSIDLNQINAYPQLNENESYQLYINGNSSFLSASTITGFIRGLSTLVQLIEEDLKTGEIFLPHVRIEDEGRFSWRGLMIDVCRHFIPMKQLKHTLDAMELAKFNVLHLHLSDDQGFRLESYVYPLLHDRKEFFTQEEMRQLVEYARQRRIRIVPEFDIPGHTTSWFVGYPNIASERNTYQVESRWGVMGPTMDPTKEETYTFLDKFFAEVTQLFPDDYFHIGGDEVEGSHWMRSTTIQRFILQHQLRNKNGLQAYFNKKIEKLLKKYNKTMVGWEEIVEETNENFILEETAVIHSWKSRKSLIDAVNKGYRALLSNGYYLDHLLTASYHYKVDPVGKDELWLFSEEQLKNILGGEACMWTEYASKDTVDTRIWPRVLAVAERLWSRSTQTDEEFLYQRLFRMNRLFHRLKLGLMNDHISYTHRLENLILDSNLKKELLHPLVILADACEGTGYPQRSQSGFYSSSIPLTTFTDALQCESELIWKLETMPINNKTFYQTFQTWSLNHLRLRALFDDANKAQSKKIWLQDIEQLSTNLAHVGRIGLRILDYGMKRRLHHDKNHTMNQWTLSQWVSHHQQLLNQLEVQVQEVRLAAVRPVRRLLNSIEKLT